MATTRKMLAAPTQEHTVPWFWPLAAGIDACLITDIGTLTGESRVVLTTGLKQLLVRR